MKFKQSLIVAIGVAGSVVAGFLPAASWAEDATVYQCKDKNGTVVFSGTPCGADAKERVVSAPNAGTGADTKGIAELADQYDKRQAQDKRDAAKIAAAAAAARAKAQADARDDRAGVPYTSGYPASGYYPDYAPGYGSGYYSGAPAVNWWVNGSGDGWSGGVGSAPPYPGHSHHDRPHRPHPAPPPVPYVYKNPGISGQFPGGAPGSSGSNFKPVKP